ncbi:hypothetical protein D3C71_1641020 [compost metagenome]
MNDSAVRVAQLPRLISTSRPTAARPRPHQARRCGHSPSSRPAPMKVISGRQVLTRVMLIAAVVCAAL